MTVNEPSAEAAKATTITVKPRPFAPPSSPENELISVRRDGAALDILHALRMDYKDFDKFVAEAGSDAKVVLEIKLRFKRGPQSLLPAKLVSLDGLASAFDEDEITLQGEGGTVRGKIVRAHHKEVVRIENAQIVKSDLTSAFAAAWDDFVGRGLIT